MRKYFLVFCFAFYSMYLSAQKNTNDAFLKIKVKQPSFLLQGASFKLQTKVYYKTKNETTGYITLSLLNHDTQKSIDGWCINIFPFQYFTTIPNQSFSTEFPFTIPSNYEGNIDVKLIAIVASLQDSIYFTIPIKKIKN